MELEVASAMRLSSSIKRQRHSHRQCWSQTVHLILCVLACVVLMPNSRITVSAYNEARFDDIKFEKTRDTLSLVLPHDTYPGYNVHSLAEPATVATTAAAGAAATNKSASLRTPSLASTTLLTAGATPLLPSTSPSSSFPMHTISSNSYYTMNKKYSKYFTVLDNGMVITTSDISPLINKPVNLVVVEETPNTTRTHQLHLIVMDRKDMLHFPTANIDMAGQVTENQPRGTRVQAIPLLRAYALSGTKRTITYSIVDGNIDDAFTLQNSKTHELSTTMSIKHSKNVGVWLVTNKPLDREQVNKYYLTIQASDNAGLDKVHSKVAVSILDENDNRPMFVQPHFKFSIVGNKTYNLEGNATVTWKRFMSIGRVAAKDGDGDKVAYRLLTPSNLIVIVPQTGELLLAGEVCITHIPFTPSNFF